MASKSERLITEALGFPTVASGISFTGTSAGQLLEADSTYRLASTEDCYIKFGVTDSGNDVANTFSTLLFGGIPEVFTVTANRNMLNVIQKDAAGTLNYTLMTQRGK